MTKYILGVRVDFLSREEVISRVKEFLGSKPKRFGQLLSTTNTEFIMSAQEDAEFKEIINGSFLSVPDGSGLLYANQFLNHYRKGNRITDLFRGIFFGLRFILEGDGAYGERITGVDLAYDLLSLAHKNGYSVFLLGGWPKDFLGRPLKIPEKDLAQDTAERIKALYPGINIVGATSQFSYNEADDQNTISYIKRKLKDSGRDSLDLLFVCYGHVKQEKWICRNSDKIPASISVGLGGTFDYISESRSRAPKILRKLNLEWFYRLLSQPWRFRRISTSISLFLLNVLFYSD